MAVISSLRDICPKAPMEKDDLRLGISIAPFEDLRPVGDGSSIVEDLDSFGDGGPVDTVDSLRLERSKSLSKRKCSKSGDRLSKR